jgi:hypothetical protein
MTYEQFKEILSDYFTEPEILELWNARPNDDDFNEKDLREAALHVLEDQKNEEREN